MDYKEILTEEAAEQFRKEGATNAVITLFNETADEVIRDIDVPLEKGIFHVAGKTIKSEAAMKKHFLGSTSHGKLWYPFKFLYLENHRNTERALTTIATVIEVDPTELEWMFINEY